MTRKITLTCLILCAALLAGTGCSSLSDQAVPSTGAVISSQDESSAAGADSSNEASGTTSESGGATPTPDNRLAPEEWQDWPVIPTLSPGMIEIYNQGVAQGNRENAFSKVGDCQIIPDVFLGIFDNPTFVLPDDMTELQGTLDRFRGSFAREGYALKGGFVFPTVFSPLRADSSVCDPGETPYECELRINKPSFVLISMEFRYDGRTAEIHEKYLRQAVEYALSRDIVPILATKADNFEGDHSLNLTTAKIAYEYDVPLWNYWRAVQHLPNHGIDWDRDSYGFHVTPAAWWERSESFLRVLDSLTKDIEKSSQDIRTNPVTETPTSIPEESGGLAITPSSQGEDILPTDIEWGTGKLVFDIKRRDFGDSVYLGIYIADLRTNELTQVSAAGTRLLDISPDFHYLLASNGPFLFTVDLATFTTQEISSSLLTTSPSSAAWDPDSNAIYYVASQGQATVLYRYQPSSGSQEVISDENPVAVLYAAHGIAVWGEGYCNAFGDCSFKSLHWIDDTGLELSENEIGEAILLPCQKDLYYVYAVRDENRGLSFHVQFLETGKETVFWSLNTEYADCAWAPNDIDIAVTLIDRGWYSGELQGYHLQLLHTDNGQVSDMSYLEDVTDQLSWSPDGRYLASTGTIQINQLYQIDLSILDLESHKATTLDNLQDFQSENFTAIDRLYWLP